jgi:DNA-binding NarL/FixJ family response regulator
MSAGEVVMRIRLLLAEDHTMVRSGIRALLEASGQIDVVGEASNGREAVELCRKLSPQVVLMDVAMSELNGIEAARQIKTAQPDVRVMMLSMHADGQYLFESLKAGASGYVLKGAAFSDLLAAIQTVAAGRSYLSPSLADLVVDDYARRASTEESDGELAQLSLREREVLQLVAEGKSSAEVAGILHISVRTAETHRHNIMKKLTIHTIAGLTKYAIRHGLCSVQ